MSEKTIPCPRCGKQPQANAWKFEGKPEITLYFCANEDCPEYMNRIMTIEHWNRRVYPVSVQRILEIAQKVVDFPHGESTDWLGVLDELEMAVNTHRAHENE